MQKPTYTDSREPDGTTRIDVLLENKVIGRIRRVKAVSPDGGWAGWRYEVRGSSVKGETMKTIGDVKRSLEAE